MPRPKSAARSPTSRRSPRSDTSKLVLGIDLGATKVISALVAPDGSIVHHGGRQVHANDGADGVLRLLVQCARSCLKDSPVPPVAVGVAVAAQVDPTTGIVIHAPNLRWRNVPLARRVEDELDLPVAVVNDARAATIAEWKHGSGRGARDLFCLFLGTGIGGSAVVDGRLLEGGNHALGEVGHITVVAGGRRCHCPNRGCLEAYAGGWAIAERAQEAVRADPTAGATLIERAGGPAGITAQTVFQAHQSGDPLAGRIVRETERFLADGVVSIVNAFNPSVLVLGGGLLTGMPEFLPVVESAIRARCQPPAAGTRVLAARLGENAPLVGAAELARESKGGSARAH